MSGELVKHRIPAAISMRNIQPIMDTFIPANIKILKHKYKKIAVVKIWNNLHNVLNIFYMKQIIHI